MHGIRLALAAMGIGLLAAPASAVTTNDYTDQGVTPGNDCSGVLGSPPDCVLNGSPLILKIDFKDDGSIDEFTFGAFPTIDGSEFSFDFDDDGFGGDGNTGTGTWTYTPDDPLDPGITGFTVKGGPNFRTFTKDNLAFLGTGDFSIFQTPPPGSGRGFAGLSHIAFFDSVLPPFDTPPVTEQPVPVPAALPLAATAMFGLGWFARRRRRGA